MSTQMIYTRHSSLFCCSPFFCRLFHAVCILDVVIQCVGIACEASIWSITRPLYPAHQTRARLTATKRGTCVFPIGVNNSLEIIVVSRVITLFVRHIMSATNKATLDRGADLRGRL